MLVLSILDQFFDLVNSMFVDKISEGFLATLINDLRKINWTDV